MVRKTRKAIKKEKVHGMSIPQLRRAFEHMDKFRDLETFRKEWKKTFGKDVSKSAAEDYLKFVSTSKGKQSGGMAPLDYQVRPGAELPYGSFPEYVSGGFGFANKMSIPEMCGKESWPGVPAGMGSNLVGGSPLRAKGRSKKETRRKGKKQKGGAFPSLGSVIGEAFSRPFGMNSPPNTFQTAQMEFKGASQFPTSDPVHNPIAHNPDITIYRASVNPASTQF
jgi:hypothetical protein